MLEYRYDTQLLIEGEGLSEDAIAAHITAHIAGDCLLCVGDETLVKIHFHTNEPWQVLAYCASLGEIYDVVIENMERQERGLQGGRKRRGGNENGRRATAGCGGRAPFLRAAAGPSGKRRADAGGAVRRLRESGRIRRGERPWPAAHGRVCRSARPSPRVRSVPVHGRRGRARRRDGLALPHPTSHGRAFAALKFIPCEGRICAYSRCAAAASASAQSVRSQGRSRSARPKWP